MKMFGTVHRTKSTRASQTRSFSVPVTRPVATASVGMSNGTGSRAGTSGFHVPVPTPTDRPRHDKPPIKRRSQLPPV